MRFQDVEITGVDLDKTKVDRDDVNRCTVTLTLSQSPPTEWRAAFDEKRVLPAEMDMKVSGEELILQGPTSELGNEWLRLAEDTIEQANDLFRNRHQYSIGAQEAVDEIVRGWELPLY